MTHLRHALELDRGQFGRAGHWEVVLFMSDPRVPIDAAPWTQRRRTWAVAPELAQSYELSRAWMDSVPG